MKDRLFIDLGYYAGAERYADADAIVAVIGGGDVCYVWVRGLVEPFTLEETAHSFLARFSEALKDA